MAVRPIFAVCLALALAGSANLSAQEGPEPAVDLDKLRDITDIEHVPPKPESPQWPWWLAVALIVALPCFIGFYRAVRRHRARPVPPLPAHEWALRELGRIQEQGLPAKGDIEHFHTLVCDVFRHYLERRFELPATRQTTPEFLNSVRDAEALAPHRDMLVRFLDHCDLAKFAPVTISPDECGEVVELVKHFIDATRPQPAATKKP
ncbi:MAG: DUF4381 family protein [Gemmataceae bacterium]